MAEAVFSVGSPTLRVSEVMFHPQAPAVGSPLEDDDFEFVEVVNVSTTDSVDLENVAFTQGIQFTFPQMTLAPGEHAVVVRNQAAFQQRYGTEIPIAGDYGNTPEDFRLNNRGETLRLVDALGQLIQQFAYDDAWYPETDGPGSSLEIIDPANSDLASWELSPSWQPSVAVGGTPGRASFVAQPGDSNLDGQFNQLDLVLVLQAGKYLTGQPAGFSDGDWNLDGVFDPQDIVAALQADNYSPNRAGP